MRVHSISDPGMGGQAQPKGDDGPRHVRPADRSPEVSLRPDEVQIEAQVEATFTVMGSDAVTMAMRGCVPNSLT